MFRSPESRIAARGDPACAYCGELFFRYTLPRDMPRCLLTGQGRRPGHAAMTVNGPQSHVGQPTEADDLRAGRPRHQATDQRFIVGRERSRSGELITYREDSRRPSRRPYDSHIVLVSGRLSLIGNDRALRAPGAY
jgi:hypothetical protein